MPCGSSDWRIVGDFKGLSRWVEEGGLKLEMLREFEGFIRVLGER